MADPADVPGSYVLLCRSNMDSLRADARARGLALIPPIDRFTITGPPWVDVSTPDGSIRLNGLVAIVSDVPLQDIVNHKSRFWERISTELPSFSLQEPRMLARFNSGITRDGLIVLERFSGANEVMENLIHVATRRPSAAARDIAQCEQWLDGIITQYMTGRGALLKIVLPWRLWLEQYEAALRSLEAGLRGLRPIESSQLSSLLDPLETINTRRDRGPILEEYRFRLNSVSEACNRISAEIGVLGTFGSLALVPFEDALGFLFLIPVAVSSVAYYGGYGLATRIRRSSLRSNPITSKLLSASSIHLSDILARLIREPVDILVSPSLAAADMACAWQLRIELMERTLCSNPLEAIQITESSKRSAIRIIIGGPLVRNSLVSTAVPICDLSDISGNGWELLADGQTITHHSIDETVGCCSVATDERTLFIFGVRDAGTIMAARWLMRAIDDKTLAGDYCWVVVRRNSQGVEWEVFARGSARSSSSG